MLKKKTPAEICAALQLPNSQDRLLPCNNNTLDSNASMSLPLLMLDALRKVIFRATYMKKTKEKKSWYTYDTQMQSLVESTCQNHVSSQYRVAQLVDSQVRTHARNIRVYG